MQSQKFLPFTESTCQFSVLVIFILDINVSGGVEGPRALFCDTKLFHEKFNFRCRYYWMISDIHIRLMVSKQMAVPGLMKIFLPCGGRQPCGLQPGREGYKAPMGGKEKFY
jgi:hypothetical protein